MTSAQSILMPCISEGRREFPPPAGCGSIFPSRHSGPCRGGVLHYAPAAQRPWNGRRRWCSIPVRGRILLQLIVEPAAAEQRFALFLCVLPFHLPEEKARKPDQVEALAVFVAQHSGVSKNPVQPFAGTGIAADHPRHFRSKLSKGPVPTGEAPHRQVKAPVDGGLSK